MRGKRGGRVVFAAEVEGSCLVGAIFFGGFKPALFHEISLFLKKGAEIRAPQNFALFRAATTTAVYLERR